MHETKMDRTERIHSNPTMMVGKLNILLSEVNRTTRQKINRNMGDLNNKINQLDLVKIKKTSLDLA